MCRTSYMFMFAFLVSCSSADDPQTHAFRILEEGGISVAETSGGSKYQEELFTYEPVLTLREDPENEESILFRPGEYSMDQNGYYYLLDGGDRRIVVFDPQGQYVRSFGREGDGPGEFRSMRFLFLTGDTLGVYDSRLLRTTLYHTDGTLINVVTIPTSGARTSSLIPIPSGRIYLSRIGERRGSLSFAGMKATYVSSIGDTIAQAKTDLAVTQYRYEFESGGGASSMDFAGVPEAIFIPTIGLVLSTGVDPILSWYDLQGKLFKTVNLVLEPVPVSAQEKQVLTKRADEALISAREAGGIRSISAEARRKAFQIIEEKAFWDEVHVDNYGYCWLRIPMMREERELVSGYQYRVLSPDGEYLGDSRWPYWSGNVVNGHLLSRQYDEETGEVTPTI